jgi:hypothetical protein
VTPRRESGCGRRSTSCAPKPRRGGVRERKLGATQQVATPGDARRGRRRELRHPGRIDAAFTAAVHWPRGAAIALLSRSRWTVGWPASFAVDAPSSPALAALAGGNDGRGCSQQRSRPRPRTGLRDLRQAVGRSDRPFGGRLGRRPVLAGEQAAWWLCDDGFGWRPLVTWVGGVKRVTVCPQRITAIVAALVLTSLERGTR